MAVLYTNNAASTLSASITNSQTSLSVASGQGALFPSLSGGNYFYATLVDGSANIEIVKVTSRSTDTFTVVRGQDGTTGRAYSAGDKVELRIVRALLDDIKTDTNGAISSSNVTTALGFTPYNATNPNGYITGINSSDVTTALGFTPYNATNPSGYITSSALSGYLTASTAASTYLPLSGGTLTGTLGLSSAQPRINLTETDGTSAYGQTTLIRNSDITSFQTRDSSGTFVSNDFIMTHGASGVSNYEWRVNNVGKLFLNANGVILNGNLGVGSAASPDYGTTGQVLTSNGSGAAPSWQTVTGGGTVTSVGITVPTGLSVSGSPVTSSGTIAISLAAGYSIPTTSSQGNWDTAYTDRLKWDGGSTDLSASTARTSLGLVIGTDVQAYDGDLAAIAALSGTSGLLRKSGANTWELDVVPYLVSINSSMVTTALGFTPYSNTNPSGYISSINSGMVTAALGFTPYNATNPSGYVTSSALSSYLTSATASSTYLPLAGGTLTGNLTLNQYTEGFYGGNTGSSYTFNLASGTVWMMTLTSSCTFTMPTAGAGKSFVVYLRTGTGGYTATFSGAKWAGGTAPTVTTTASRMDIFSFVSDGSNWYGVTGGQNYTP